MEKDSTPLPTQLPSRQAKKKKILISLSIALIFLLGIILIYIGRQQSIKSKAGDITPCRVPPPCTIEGGPNNCTQQGPLKAGCCKKKTPVCYEVRSEQGMISYLECRNRVWESVPGCGIEPSPTTPVITQPPQPSPTPQVSITPTKKPSITPPEELTPTPSVCPVPEPVANLEVTCPVCE